MKLPVNQRIVSGAPASAIVSSLTALPVPQSISWAALRSTLKTATSRLPAPIESKRRR
jgi:hypothetical protein